MADEDVAQGSVRGAPRRWRRLPRRSVAWSLASATATLATIVIAAVSSASLVAVAAIVGVFALYQSLRATAIRPEWRRSTDRTDDLRRHISAARRRDERVDLLAFELSRDGAVDHATLLESFRLTDTASVRRVAGSSEVEIVLDHEGLDRAGVERRIATHLGALPRFGWATFPDDGVTLEALLERARSRTGRGPVEGGSDDCDGSPAGGRHGVRRVPRLTPVRAPGRART